jgi:hypothetical protein
MNETFLGDPQHLSVSVWRCNFNLIYRLVFVYIIHLD